MQLLGDRRTDGRTYGYFAVILYRALSPTELESLHTAHSTIGSFLSQVVAS